MRILMCLLSTITLVISTSLEYVPFKNLFTIKQRKLAFSWYVGLLSSYFIGYYLLDSFYETGPIFYKISMILVGTAPIIVNICILSDRWREMVFTGGLVAIIVLMPMTCGAFVCEYININDYHLEMVLLQTIVLVIFIIAYIPEKRLLLKTITPFLGYEGKLYWRNVCFIPDTMFAANFLVTPIGKFVTLPGEVAGRLMLGTVTLLLCRSVAYAYEQIQEKEMLNKQIGIQKKYYDVLLDSVHEARKNRHDMKHHLIAIDSLLKQNDIDKLEKYISTMYDRTDLESQIYYTGNSALDGVLYHYMVKSQRDNVKFSFTGSVPQLGDKEIDFCILIGNALDNALTACETTNEKKWVSVQIQYDQYTITISISNTFDGIVNRSNDVFLSRKRNNLPGYGIRSMKDICNKYKGICKFIDDNKIFQAVFIINVGQDDL